MEGKLVSALIRELAEKDGLDMDSIRGLQNTINFLEREFDGLGFCLSKEGDILSQWRGYSSDATGVSIGFSKNYLEKLACLSRTDKNSGFTLQRVEYEREAQIKLIKPTYEKIREFIDKGAYKPLGLRTILDTRSEREVSKDNEDINKAIKSLSLVALTFFKDLFLLKHEAFKEEQEWRLLSYLITAVEDPCMFLALNDRIVPYREFTLPRLDGKSISEVVVGPKNRTPHKVIESLMKKNGFLDVKITSSIAPYQ